MKFKDIVNREIVNLQNCEQEPIHIPGSIQPHGFLLGIDKNSFSIVFCSENSLTYTGAAHNTLLGKNFAGVFGENTLAELLAADENTNEPSVTFKMNFNGRGYEFIAHTSGDTIILEAEINTEAGSEEIDLFKLSKQYLNYMEETHTLKQLCGLVADGIQKITGYDRVMIYRFDEMYNGEVIAENKRDDLESFLGLHYPHTDIPPQARELYIKNLLRVIVDVNYTPVPIYTIDNGLNKNLDLSYSVLRSVSPIHCQYLNNMGVGATLTISLLHKKKLWGLVACHHYSPKYIGNDVKLAAKLQGHFITSQIDVRQANEEFVISKKTTRASENIISLKLELNRKSLDKLVNDPNLLQLCNATGVSFVIDNEIYSAGLTPPEDEVKRLAADLAKYTEHSQLHTSSLSKALPGLKNVSEQYPGINYHSLDSLSDNCIIWYKAETVTEVNWAGDPNKTIEKDTNGLSPRKSFALWKEVVKSQSNPWLPSELATSLNFVNILQRHLSSVLLAEEEEKQRELARILQQTNAELENINWISTHDLQEPLRKIRMTASLLLATEQDSVPGHFYEKVNKMNLSAERMQVLIKDILKYTKLSYTREIFEQVDMNVLMAEVVNELAENIKDKYAVVNVASLPVINGVPFLLKQLFSNLIYNSLKFSSKERLPEITISADINISGDDARGGTVISFADNGIGFDKEFNQSVFNIFSRLHTLEEYNGSGIGLALCKKIMETHKGSISADGNPGEGAVFSLYFPSAL